MGGQVYLISINRFIEGFEKQYKKSIPEKVKRAIELFWGSAEDTTEIIDKIGTKKDYEYRKHRLVADTLYLYNEELYYELLNWVKENTDLIADFCFSRGLAKNEEDWADIVWYKNEVGEYDENNCFYIKDLCKKLQEAAATETEYGKVGGGTTIQLAFGFVQWHSPSKTIPGQIQFHHSYIKIANLFKKI